jgi:hypothetical protein
MTKDIQIERMRWALSSIANFSTQADSEEPAAVIMMAARTIKDMRRIASECLESCAEKVSDKVP